MEGRLAMELLSEAAALGVDHVHVTGGEPLVRRDLGEICAFAASLGVTVEVQTSGALMDAASARELAGAGVSRVYVSLDGDAATHDDLRGNGAYRAARAAIEASIGAGMSVTLNVCVTRRSADAALAAVDDLDALGVEAAAFLYYTPAGRGAVSAWLPPAAWIDYVSRLDDRVTEAAPSCRVKVEPAYFSPSDDPLPCLERAGGLIFVRSDGAVFGCGLQAFTLAPRVFYPQVDLATAAARVRADARSRPLPEGCEGCPEAARCGGGCPAYPSLEGTSAGGRDPRCDLLRADPRHASWAPGCPCRLRPAGRIRGGGS